MADVFLIAALAARMINRSGDLLLNSLGVDSVVAFDSC